MSASWHSILGIYCSWELAITSTTAATLATPSNSSHLLKNTTLTYPLANTSATVDKSLMTAKEPLIFNATGATNNNSTQSLAASFLSLNNRLTNNVSHSFSQETEAVVRTAPQENSSLITIERTSTIISDKAQKKNSDKEEDLATATISPKNISFPKEETEIVASQTKTLQGISVPTVTSTPALVVGCGESVEPGEQCGTNSKIGDNGLCTCVQNYGCDKRRKICRLLAMTIKSYAEDQEASVSGGAIFGFLVLIALVCLCLANCAFFQAKGRLPFFVTNIFFTCPPVLSINQQSKSMGGKIKNPIDSLQGQAMKNMGKQAVKNMVG